MLCFEGTKIFCAIITAHYRRSEVLKGFGDAMINSNHGFEKIPIISIKVPTCCDMCLSRANHHFLL